MKKVLMILFFVLFIVGCGKSDSSNEDGALKVYFEKPAEWGSLQVYFYETSNGDTIEWASAPAMKSYEGKEGWYYYEFKSDIKSARVIFKDDKGNQIPASGEPGQLINTTTWFFSDYSYVLSDPFTDSKPIITVSPKSIEFIDEIAINIKIISNSEIKEMYYTLDGEKYELNSKESNITIGSDAKEGDVIKLKITAVNNIGTTTTEEYKYTKEENEILTKVEDFNNLRIYQIMVPTYIDGIVGGYGTGYGPSHHNGDLQGVIDALDYIESLGINAIWLTPVFDSQTGEIKGQATGYYADDYYNVDPKFGTNEKLKELIQKLHEKNMYIFLDGVFGHHGSKDIEGVVNGPEQWYGYEVVYPDSLAYFEDVAAYWIDEYEIDGWRLDQAYQLYQNGKNYWKYIRRKVEKLSYERKQQGKEWGTLGYMVGEIWDGGGNQINEQGYSQNGLRSCFDFPMRYSLVQVLATQENKGDAWAMNQPASKLNDTYNSVNQRYPDYAQPNMFFSNHDVVRFGDLIQRAGKSEYWERHKLAISFLTAYTGPITFFYGDEYGEEVEGYINEKDLGYYDDHSGRTEGKISNFNTEEQDLIDYTKKMMQIRKENKALWNGERTNITATQYLYADLKSDGENKVIYAMNVSNKLKQTLKQKFNNTTINQLKDLITGELINITDNEIDIELQPMEAKFYLILN